MAGTSAARSVGLPANRSTSSCESLAWSRAASGRLNVNDALLVVLQSEGRIGEVASFDSVFDVVSDSRDWLSLAEVTWSLLPYGCPHR